MNERHEWMKSINEWITELIKSINENEWTQLNEWNEWKEWKKWMNEYREIHYNIG